MFRQAGRKVSPSFPAHSMCAAKGVSGDRYNTSSLSALSQWLLASAFCLLSSAVWAATPANTTITNIANASCSVGPNNLTANASAAVNTAACIDVNLKIELLQYIPPANVALAPTGSQIEMVQPGGYAPGGALAGPFILLAQPTLPGNPAATPLPSNLLLAPMNDAANKPIAAYARNEPIFVRVLSLDANTTAAVDRVSVTLSTSKGGDIEVLQLSETGPSTGVFVGVLPSQFTALGTVPTPHDGILTTSAYNENITGSYSHPSCTPGGAAIISYSSALIDPLGIVFDSMSGAPVNGAAVSLIDAVTNQPTLVFCDDGVTVLPQPVSSGSATICDAAMTAGGFRFPQAAAGNYKLSVLPPQGYAFPSAVLPANLPASVGTPAVVPSIIGSPGLPPGASYGGVFALLGTILRLDIPADPGSLAITIRKTAGKAVVGTGEFVPYSLSITNNSAAVALTGASIADHLPPGFRYQKGSARLNGAVTADPLVAPDASMITFTLNIAPAALVTLRYVLEVTPGARPGMAENSAAATGLFISNTARASVLVREDLYRNKAILIGRVIDGSCDDKVDNDAKGVANARVVLQDGSYVLTDSNGRWHIDNLRPGTHVVQLDPDALPEDYEVLACEQNSRFAGRSYSQFVNLRGGSLWRADFHVQKRSASERTSTKVPVKAAATPPATTSPNNDPARLLEKLPYDEAWLASALPGNEWLHPQESFHPNLPVMKVAVKHNPQQKLVLSVNGVTVNPLLFDGAKMNAARSIALSSWNAVPLKEGANSVQLVVIDAAGQEISRTMRSIYYAATPDHVEFMPQQSHLIADGKTRPMIAVRFLDKNGVPVRRGISGEFQLNEPYRAYDRREAIDGEPLTGRINGKPRFEINSDGLAMIELEPTTQSGEAILNFPFNDQRTQEVRAWLQAGQRDWILVGFAEGTAGHKTLSGNLQALQAADTERQLFDDNKLALYAKGSIRGDYLLTAAYDTTKQTGNPLLKQAVDPTQYYTLYADATQARFDAASASRLYVKLERKQFYAMFGDYDTGLSVTELSRYSRTVNGVKSEYRGEKVGYNAFASVTAQAYVKDEIPGNGTSGIYKLSRGNLVINSDKIRVESRDRFQSQTIVSTQNLTRYLDYDIDYALGTLTFHQPMMSRDGNFNPTYIVVEYESADPADKKATFGGRSSFKPDKATEIGATLIHEGTVGATGNLRGVDASYQADDKTKLRAEAARSNGNRAGIASGGSAWLGEITHREDQWDTRAYVRQQGDGFGMGQQAASEGSTRKMGVDGRRKLTDSLQLQGQAFKQENLTTNASNNLIEGRVDQKLSDDLNAYYGARTAQDQNAAGNTQSNQLLAGAAYTMPDKKLGLHGAAEVGYGRAGSATMPDRLIFGADYKVTELTKLFAEQEFARGQQLTANTTRAGLRTQPWSGGEMSASVGNSINNDAERLYSNLGLVQRWQVNAQWQADFSIDRSQTLRNNAAPLNLNTPLPSGSGGLSGLPSTSGDYTATALGVAYHDKLWSGNGRVEFRNASIDQQRNLQLGMQRNLDEGRAMAAGVTLRHASGAGTTSNSSDLRLSYAHRPNDSQWVWFDRADYITQFSQAAGLSINGAKLVNNLNANYMPNRHTQIALQYGAKYVRDSIDGTDYKGYTDLIGTEIRYDVTQDWDVGTFGSLMRSLNSGVRSYSLGASIGYNVLENSWLSVGYNLRGLNDRDFTAAAYRARGPFVTLRMKVDQDTFGLNKGSAMNRLMDNEQ
ncbi:MAG: hypothetical protein CO186_10775 [Zetaproteobacteria bacterium CG_4_9_14_3_um_filter_49_83]|nr:MAG: hypothetical protein AUJ56_09165 [Zetaproteobacteria bacterium CG1_02_49_23]PIQ33346.1 MAG: hypothetical protein COW62_05760 [Zetaproteobacteria bacterium CG17_big_fil_post_rev_8_21_14_2_50_50_13]PIY57082.1 MAG: hypothetical protein COZ00_00940 [Zetaproteobacteria bacterium CG_4_10_14_0_8_um_filter_49_80]PJA34378.1 MAG: hypothetical protein CO186_10775 [Zetaproteobacteria bacterium CG_4_9_14_3_um_filter_49_83]